MLSQKQQIIEQIKKANDILITFPKQWNGDSVASALAIFLFLKKLNKKADIIADRFNNHVSLSFLPFYKEIKNSVENLRKFIVTVDASRAKISQIKYRMEDGVLNFIISVKEGLLTSNDVKSHSNNFKYDLIVAVGASDLESLGNVYEENRDLFYKTPIINIDNHSSNEEFGQINFIELTAVSTSEIIFSLIQNYSPDLIDEDMATCLLAGMISETRSFKTANITPQALSIAAHLIANGARREEIVNALYRSRPINTLKLWGRVLARLSSSLNGILVWSTLSHLDFIKTGAGEADLAEVIDELILNMPEVKVIALFYENLSNGQINTNCILYSLKNIDSQILVKEFNPTGSKNMAKIEINKPVQQAEKEIISLIEERLKKIQQ